MAEPAPVSGSSEPLPPPTPMSPVSVDSQRSVAQSRDSVMTDGSYAMVSPASPINLPPPDQEGYTPTMTANEVLATLEGDYKNVVKRGSFVREGAITKPQTFRDKKMIAILFSNSLLIARTSKSAHPLRKVEEVIDLREWYARPCVPPPVEEGKKKSKSEEKKAQKLLCSFELVCHTDPSRNQIYVVESHAVRDRWIFDIATSTVEALRGPEIEGGPGKEISLHTDQLRLHVMQFGSTVHSAALLGQADVIVGFMAGGQQSQVDTRDPSGSTALHLATLANWPQIVQLLVSHGADMNVADQFGHIPLHVAVVYGREMIAEQLASSELCNANFQDYLGRTPVTLALYHESINVLRSLCRSESVQHGLKGRDSQGLTPLMRACQLGMPRAARILIQANADILAQAGEPLNKPEDAPLINAGRTPLGFAVINDDIDCVKVCVEEGGSWMNAKDMNGDTLLHTCPTLPIADYLIQHGARMDIPNTQGRYGGRFIGNVINPELDKAGNQAIVEKAIQVAKGMWEARREDGEMVRPVPGSRLFKPQMIPDESSPECVICASEFSLLKRRHHCRNCGVLVCALCSSKKFRLPHLSPQYQSTGALPPADRVTQERVCDGCFNFLYHLSHNAERLTVEGPDPDAQAELDRAELLGPRESRTTTSAEQDWLDTMNEASATTKSRHDTNKAQSAALDAKKGLEERGEKLNSLAENMERLNNEAADFEKMCSQLAAQEKKKSSWW